MTAVEKIRLDKEGITKNEKLSLKKNNNLIKIDNQFIEGFLSKNNTVALKIIFYIARIHNYDHKNLPISKTLMESTTRITLDTKTLCRKCNIVESQLNDNLERLMKTTITTVDNKEELVKYALIPRTKRIYGKHLLEIDIYNYVLNFIIQIEKNYTTMDFNNIMNIKNKHSLKMIQLLERISRFGDKVAKRKFYSLEEMNEMFGTKYRNNKEFQIRILDKVQEELDMYSKLSFLYESVYTTVGKGRPKSKGFMIDIRLSQPYQPTLI